MLDDGMSKMIGDANNLLMGSGDLLSQELNDRINNTLDAQNASINGTMSEKLKNYS